MPRTCLLACLAWVLSATVPAWAQAVQPCPILPGGSGLRWEQREVPGMVLCKALSSADGTEMFSVTLGGSLPFRPVGSQQVGRGMVGGQRVRWYRGSDGFDPTVQVRETLLRLGRGRDAHVVVRAASEDQLEARMQLLEGLAFEP